MHFSNCPKSFLVSAFLALCLVAGSAEGAPNKVPGAAGKKDEGKQSAGAQPAGKEKEAPTDKKGQALRFSDIGRKAAEAGQYQQAVDAFTSAIKLDPACVPAYKQRAAAYLGLGRKTDALADYDKIIKINPDMERYYTERAVVYEKLNMPQKALGDYDQIIRLNPTRDTPHYQKAAIYEKLHDYKHAAAEFTIVIGRNNKDDEAFTKRGHAYMLMGDYNKALADLTSAIDLDPGYGMRAYEDRITVYEKLGKPDLAAKDRQKLKSLKDRDY